MSNFRTLYARIVLWLIRPALQRRERLQRKCVDEAWAEMREVVNFRFGPESASAPRGEQ